MNKTIEMRSSNVVLRMRFSMYNPPKYLKGKDKLAYMEERAWVSNDYIDYCAREGKYADKAESADCKFAITPEKGTYLEYVSRRGNFADKDKLNAPIGMGIFGKNGNIEGEELERVKKHFQTTKSHIWHGIISPSRELGDKFLKDKEMAKEFVQSCFTRFLSSTHLDYDNVEWYAGWHDDSASGIKHIQFAFCEKDQKLNKFGEVAYTQKGLIKKSTLADALINFEEYFSGHRNDVHLARDDISQKFKNLNVRNIKTNIADALLKLAQDLPNVVGRAGYNHKAYEPFRERIDKLSDKLIKSVPELNKSYIKLISRVSEREERFLATAKDFKNMQPTDKVAELRKDIKARLGNSIISVAKRMKFTIENDNAFMLLHQERLSMMEQMRKESKLRRKKQSERRKEIKRIRRAFDNWYSEMSAPDYLEEFYLSLQRFKDNTTEEINYLDMQDKRG